MQLPSEPVPYSADAVRQELTRRGHVIAPMGGFSGAMGNGEAVMHDAKRGVNFGGSDPRTDGAAIPEQPPLPALKGQAQTVRSPN